VNVYTNSGPLVALSKLGCLHLLSELFDRVELPSAVHREVVLEGRRQGYADALVVGEAIRKGRLVVVNVADGDLPYELDALPLDRGEKQAIYLASRTSGGLVLLDDLLAREKAQERGLSVKGTLGVIAKAYGAKLLDYEEVVGLFEAIASNETIWIADELCRRVLTRLEEGAA
jgi:predicted nucleic acid-binding protein